MKGVSPPPLYLAPQTLTGVNAMSAQSTPLKRLPQIDRTKVDPEDLRAAQGMEAMFLDYMMNAMRKTVPKNEMDMENTGTDIYRGMLDSEVAERAAHAGGIGLADQIIAYLQAQRYNLRQEKAREPGLRQDAEATQRQDAQGAGKTLEK